MKRQEKEKATNEALRFIEVGEKLSKKGYKSYSYNFLSSAPISPY